MLSTMSLHDLIHNWNGSNQSSLFRNEIRRRAAAAKMSVVDYIEACLTAAARGVPFTPAHREVKPCRFKIIDNRSTVDKLTTDASIYHAVDAMLESGWDFIDPEKRMIKTPEEVSRFLESMRDGPTTSYGELHPSHQGLLRMIRDAWWRAVLAERKGLA
jgi:hypothetical protein